MELVVGFNLEIKHNLNYKCIVQNTLTNLIFINCYDFCFVACLIVCFATVAYLT